MSMVPQMKCPKCGAAMEEGYVFSTGHVICWTKYKSGYLKKYDTLLRGFLKAPKTEAYRCQNCKIVLFSYEEDKKKEEKAEE